MTDANHQPFRRVSGTMFIDESGAAQPVTDPLLAEVNAIGGISIPRSESDHAALTQFVDDVMYRRFGDRSKRGEKLKVAMLTDSELECLASLFRTSPWYMVYENLPPNTPADNVIWNEMWDNHRSSLAIAVNKVHKSARDPQKIEQLFADFDQMRAKHPMWSWLVFRAMDMMASLFRRNSTFPSIRVVIDEHGGHTIQQKRYLQFLCRFAFSSHFPEIYGDHLSAILGLKADNNFTCETSTDKVEDGLILADLVASASRTLRRKADKRGRIKKFFDMCNVASNNA